MIRAKWLVVLGVMALTVALPGVTVAQTGTRIAPIDVTNPLSDVGRIPGLINGIIRPQDAANLVFDSLLDPSNGSDPMRFTAAAQSIRNNHIVAQQQVELAIRFLEANRDDILAGRNNTFNSIFGNVGTKVKVAILAPVPVVGNFDLVSPTLIRSMPQGGGGGGQGGSQISLGSVGTQLRTGGFLFLDTTPPPANNNNPQPRTYPSFASVNRNNSANNNNNQDTGFVVRIAGIVEQTQGGNQGGGQNNNNNDTDIYLDSTFATLPANLSANNLTLWRVVRFEEQADPSVFEQILATYKAIREALAGFDPGQARAAQNRNDIQYNRRFRDINAEYQVGDADFTRLDSRINDFIPGRGADRLVRQAGFSKSQSFYHLDRLEDIGNNVTTDRNGDPVVPLLWTQDNLLPLTFGDRRQFGTDEDRAFFRDRQTIFGGLDNPFQQYLGPAFLREQIREPGIDFFDQNIDATDLQTGIRQRRDPAGDVLQFLTSQNSQVPDLESALVPESGTPGTASTLQKWQMIIESFAESNSDLDRRDLTNSNITNVAAVGLMEIVGGSATSTIRASDAGNYGRFSGLIGSSAAGGIDFNRVEPPGKRGSAGFNPVVPVN